MTRDREKTNANHGRALATSAAHSAEAASATKGGSARRQSPRTQTLVFRFTRIAARALLSPFFRVRIEGLDWFPRHGSFLLLPKHQRWEDVPLLGLTVPRPLFYVAKHELFESRLSRWFISSLGGIPLNRKRPLQSRQSIRALFSLLGRGEGIVIFPEGTYYPKTMGPGRSGLIRMICSRIRIPCIPVGIRYLPDRFPRSVRIVFGEPILGGPEMDGPEFQERIMRKIARLSGLDFP